MKILLTGDSWAAGDWNQARFRRSLDYQPVLQDLLVVDNNEVILKPGPGEADLSSLTAIRKYANSVDLIIFFKTQTSRLCTIPRKKIDLEFYNFVKGKDWPTFADYKKNNFFDVDDNIFEEMIDLGVCNFKNLFIGYAQKQKSLNEIFYEISKNIVYRQLYKNSHKILLIGGLEDIDTTYQFKYSIRSLIEFLTNQKHNNYTFSSVEFEKIYKLISKLKLNLEIKNQLLKELLEMYDNSNRLKNTFQKNNNFFGPIDNSHPNKKAIEYYYYQLIKPKLEEFKNDYRTAI